MPAIDLALKFCGATPQDLSAVYVCQGPGSFTGLRIGIATAKGIAFGLNIPLFAYNSLELCALAVSGLGRNILCAIDAKMKEIYSAYYTPLLTEISPPELLSPVQLCQHEEDDFILCGSATGMLIPLLQESGHHFYPANSTLQIPNAAGLFALAELLPAKALPRKLAELEPLYLRESTAQVQNKAH